MATTTQAPPRVIRRPAAAPTGIWSWLTTVDHKRIGYLYGGYCLHLLPARRARRADDPLAARQAGRTNS